MLNNCSMKLQETTKKYPNAMYIIFCATFVYEKLVFQISVAVCSQWTKDHVSITKNLVGGYFGGINRIRLYRYVPTDEIWIQCCVLE